MTETPAKTRGRAAAKPAPETEVPDFDALIGDDSVVPEPDGKTLVTNAADSETPEQRRIRELEEELALPLPEEEPEFIPTAQLSPEQQRIRDLEDRLAQRNALIAERQAATFEQIDGQGRETLLIHVLIDGFSINGQVMYRGQEVEFVVGGQAYEQTKDKNGDTWLDLVNDQQGQYRRWGKVYFGPGPWPFSQWGSTDGLTDPDEIAAAEAAAKAERKRNRAAPVVR